MRSRPSHLVFCTVPPTRDVHREFITLLCDGTLIELQLTCANYPHKHRSGLC